jgi:Flp pilus assembly protein TadD
VQYRHAVALFPDDFATHYNLGRALHVWGDDRAAIAPYLKAVALAPGEPSFYLSLRTDLRGPRPPC